MKITNPAQYIILGGRIRYLARTVKGQPILGENLIYENFKWVKQDLKDLGFKVSSNLFLRILDKLEQQFKDLEMVSKDGEVDNHISAEQSSDLANKILELENTILSEAKSLIIASPVPRRFSLNHLLNNPGEILGSKVYNSLTEMARYDLDHACRSIAFECPTAAAFHILRCVEECVRILFRAYFPRGDANRPWGSLIRELISKPRNPKPEEILLEHLNHLRKRFRNPTDHPEKLYEIEEAEDLVHLSVDVINRVSKDTKVIDSKKR